MRKMLLALPGVATLALFGASQSLAAPASGSSIAAGLNEMYRKRSDLLLQ